MRFLVWSFAKCYNCLANGRDAREQLIEEMIEAVDEKAAVDTFVSKIILCSRCLHTTKVNLQFDKDEIFCTHIEPSGFNDIVR